MSLAGPVSSPRACSGDMKAGVPIDSPCIVIDDSPEMRAIPKSATRIPPSGSMRMLLGLMSRWTTPASWASASASAAATPICAVCRQSRGPCAAM